MKMHLLPFVTVSCLALLVVTGCESDGLSARIQEKSAVYATLKPWQKKNIDAGVVAMSFTPDMVYMAVGNPTTKEPAGTGEMWTYKNYYPTVGASRVRYSLNSETSTLGTGVTNGIQMESNGKGGQQVAGSGQGGGHQSIGATGGAQGGSMEPADLSSYTLYITFENGVVTKLKLDPN